MTRDHQYNPDPDLTAARIVAESIAKQEPLARAYRAVGAGLRRCVALNAIGFDKRVSTKLASANISGINGTEQNRCRFPMRREP